MYNLQCFSKFCKASEQTAIISLYSINWLVLLSRRIVFTARYELYISDEIQVGLTV